MINHIDLGKDPAERKKNIGPLIRSGVITLGGYKKARIYGLLSCTSGKKMKAENRVFFAGEAEALASGYRPCGHCLPEKYRKWKAGQPFDPTLSDAFMERLTAAIQWKQEPVRITGQEILQPRFTAWYGDPGKSYSYTGITMHPLPWTNDLLTIKRTIEE